VNGLFLPWFLHYNLFILLTFLRQNKKLDTNTQHIVMYSGTYVKQIVIFFPNFQKTTLKKVWKTVNMIILEAGNFTQKHAIFKI